MEEQKLLKRKRKANSENNQILLISACTDLAELYVKEGRHHLAVEEYKEVANIYKSQNKLIEYGQANRGIGEAYLGLHDFKKALEHQRIYLDVANQKESEIEKQRALATIGHIYLSWYLETQSNPENLDLAYRHFIKSLKVAEGLTENSGINKLERADMLARLFSNLGLVKECLGEYDAALKLLNQSITICKKNDIYEQLSRGYISVASLSEKRGNVNEAIRHYNLAIDSAKKLKNNDLMGAALLAKSESLIKLADFHSAKQILLKAYKLKTPNIQERKSIERNLKIVAAMCNTEDKLVTTCDNLKVRKELYEKMGDGACELKNYTKAIEYYRLMLECAERSGVNGRELASCYYSLAETYKDNSQFKEAIDYFEKEYELCADLKDSLNTLSKIADTKETAGAAVSEVKAVYERAFSNCRSRMNVKEEKRMVSRCINYLRRSNCHSDAFELSQYVQTLDKTTFEEDSSSSECESEDSEAKVHIGDDINLDDITDDSDDSDIENKHTSNKQETSVGKRKNKNFVVKKNEKGESQLHTACIKGLMPVVHHLVEQGHPVNVRDHSGWLPLHEASNYGHVEIVRYLLDKGAAINDRGGTHCNGITPLYDAAYNGNLRVVELLLDRGASAIVKTDEGDTPLNILKEWQKNNPVYGEELSLYQSLVKRMSDALEKTGQNTKSTTPCRSQTPEVEVTPRRTQRESRFRRSASEVLDIDLGGLNEDVSGEISDDCGADEYREVMGMLRNKPNINPIKETSPNVSKRSALVSVDDNVDNWLENDVQVSNAAKKRKTIHGNELTMPTVRPSGSREGSGQKKTPSPKKRASDDFEIPHSFFEEDFEDAIIMEGRSSSGLRERRVSNESCSSTGSSTGSTSRGKRKNQMSLLDAGFSRICGDNSSFNRNYTDTNGSSSSSSLFKRINSFENRSRPQQQKLTSMGHTRDVVEADSTTLVASQARPAPEREPVQCQTPAVGDLMVYVDVKIEEMVFRVPVLLSQIQTNSIGWLAEQAATKYARKQCIRPTLELETITGALLSDEDSLSLLFPLGATQAELVVGRIVKLNIPPLVERYKEACTQMNTDIDNSLCTILEEMSITLSLKDSGFLSKRLTPLCKALNYQTSLLELNLSGNFLDTDSVMKLCSSLPSLTNLSSLNLRCTGLMPGHLAELVKVLSSSNTPVLQKLTDLNLSDNILKDNSLPHLAQITGRLTLTSLNLSNVRFTENLFGGDNENWSLNLREIQFLDLSDNQLETKDINTFMSWTVASKIVSLNISRNSPDNQDILAGLVEFLHEEHGDLELRSLNLSQCNVSENELYEFLSLCCRMPLSDINLSYNARLTGISLRRLLECSQLENINLIGCADILKYFDDCGGCDLLRDSNRDGEKVLKISPTLKDYPGQVETLVDMFKNKYPDCYIEKGTNYLLLSCRILNK